MISKSKVKLVRSLALKKYRQEERLFVAEGGKIVTELLNVTPCVFLAATKEWLSEHQKLAETDVFEVSQDELVKISLQQHPQDVVAVFKQLETSTYCPAADELTLALDGVQDPGNFGTIIRIADWFGIEHVLCSEATADIYNPKVVQATMGSIARVNVEYVNLYECLSNLQKGFPIYGTLLDGNDIYTQDLTTGGIIIMGNESAGISTDIRSLITSRLLLPNYPSGRPTAESLNVAIATAITCAEFRRRIKI